MRCAVIDTGHANTESASDIHLLFVQASAGTDLRRPMINLAYVFGQTVQTGHSETVRDKASVKRRSRTSLDLVLWSTRGGPRLERAGQKLLFRARRRPTGPPCATADGEAHWEGLPTHPLRAGGEHANCEELLLVAVVRMRKAGLTHREQCMQKRNRGSPQQHGSSGSQKQSALFKRQGLTQFTPDFVEWLTNESLEDTSMGMAMPRGRYGEEVWTSAFFDSVKVELDRRQQGTGIFVCAFDRTDGDNQPTGVTDIASRRLITLLTGPAYKVRDEKEALRKARWSERAGPSALVPPLPEL